MFYVLYSQLSPNFLYFVPVCFSAVNSIIIRLTGCHILGLLGAFLASAVTLTFITSISIAFESSER